MYVGLTSVADTGETRFSLAIEVTGTPRDAGSHAQYSRRSKTDSKSVAPN